MSVSENGPSGEQNIRSDKHKVMPAREQRALSAAGGQVKSESRYFFSFFASS